MSASTPSSASFARLRLVRRCALLVGLLALSWAGTGTALASARTGAKLVRYDGYSVVVPGSWPVYKLAADPTVCVRFNRHAVYLGQPGSEQDCPAHSVGRTEAILIEPSTGAGGGGGAAGARVVKRVNGPAAGGRSDWGELSIPAHGVTVTATWRQDPAIVERALGRRSLPPMPAPSASGASSPTASGLAPKSRAHLTGAVSDPVYTGLGFDACSTPSASQMVAWASSPYRAVGIYIGGTNEACSQPNSTAGWVASEVAAGWHLIPIYVGLQAPGNSCGCGSINPSQAAAEGTAAASDAVNQAKALGIGTGNPLYFDMEAYTPGGSTTSAVLAFLGAWTAQLHADGYLSGVYSSAASGVSDLVDQYGTGNAEPDDIWFADWNGEETTSSSYIPSGDWSDHQRLHQYSGGVNATYGGVTINIDGDYLDGATAGAGDAAGASSDTPTASTGPTISGDPSVGQTLVEGHGNWSGGPTSYGYQWEDCNSAGADCSPIPVATGQSYTLTASDLGYTIRVQETATDADGAGTPAASAPTGLVHGGSLWVYTGYGNVYESSGATFYGSPFASHAGVSSIVGMASTVDGRGYWLVDSAAKVFRYGDAASVPALAHSHPIKGIVADPNGGYWLYTAHGNVYNSAGAGFYGSPFASRDHLSSIVGMGATANGRGYWLITSAGKVYAYGDAASLLALAHSQPIKGIVADPNGGYWLYTAHGNVYNSAGAGFYGSPFASRDHLSSIVGMGATANGRGYWLVTSAGKVYAYGGAAAMASLPHAHPIMGLVP